MNPSNQAFGKWLVECGFDDIKQTTRADAMWLANNWSVLQSLDNEISHPANIRMAHNESQSDLPPTPGLTLTPPSRLTASIEQVAPQAKRINKLVAMAELGEGQEKETAQRYLNKKAKEFGMEAGELSNL